MAAVSSCLVNFHECFWKSDSLPIPFFHLPQKKESGYDFFIEIINRPIRNSSITHLPRITPKLEQTDWNKTRIININHLRKFYPRGNSAACVLFKALETKNDAQYFTTLPGPVSGLLPLCQPLGPWTVLSFGQPYGRAQPFISAGRKLAKRPFYSTPVKCCFTQD